MAKIYLQADRFHSYLKFAAAFGDRTFVIVHLLFLLRIFFSTVVNFYVAFFLRAESRVAYSSVFLSRLTGGKNVSNKNF